MPTYSIYTLTMLTFSGARVTLGTPYDRSQSTTLVVTDDDAVLSGDSSNDETGNHNNRFGTATLANGTVIGSATTRVYSEEQYILTAPGQLTITLYRVEIDTPGAAQGVLVGYLPSDPLVPGVTYNFTTANTTDRNDPSYTALDGALCLTADSLVRTMTGDRPTGQLSPGDLVTTRDHGHQPLRWIGIQEFGKDALAANPKLRPVRIAAGALGENLPRRDLVVSRQHRMLVSSRIAVRMFGASEVLIPAIRLVGLPGISIDEKARQVAYVHLLFDQHEVIFAEGAPTESLYVGAEALATIPTEARDEIFAIFPELRTHDEPPRHALPVPPNRLQKRLVESHGRNGRFLLEKFGQ